MVEDFDKMDNSDHDFRKFLGLARDLFGRLVYTHKTHEKDREIWSRRVRITRWINVVLIGVTSILAIVGSIYSSQTIFVITAVIGALTTAFVVYQLSFNPEKLESEHRMASKRLLCLRDRYLLLIERVMSREEPTEELRNKLDLLHRETSLVYEYAPDTSARAYKVARLALQFKEEMTFRSEEIDMLLPLDLRLTGAKSNDEKGD